MTIGQPSGRPTASALQKNFVAGGFSASQLLSQPLCASADCAIKHVHHHYAIFINRHYIGSAMSATTADRQTDKLELKYIPLAQASRWDQNPKRHDLPALIRSIETHGFGDPPKFDATLGALVYGNGRSEALERMRSEGKAAPRGIAVLESGEWAVPVIFGVDAESRAAAVAFAIDHNNLTLLGGGLGFADLLAIWDEQGLQRILSEVPDASKFLASLDSQDLDSLINGPSFEPAGVDDQSRLDEKKLVVCPECGCQFRPKK